VVLRTIEVVFDAFSWNGPTRFRGAARARDLHFFKFEGVDGIKARKAWLEGAVLLIFKEAKTEISETGEQLRSEGLFARRKD
jgi:hypothetical protein